MMESVPQSEEMLAEMLGDGKVSPEEYERLLEALRAKKTEPSPHRHPLRRSRYNQQLQGVCGGLAEYFDIEARIVRAIFLILFIFSFGGPGVLVYVVLWLALSRETPRRQIEELELQNKANRLSLVHFLALVGMIQIVLLGYLIFGLPSILGLYRTMDATEMPLVTRLASAHLRFLTRSFFISIPLYFTLMGALAGAYMLLQEPLSRAKFRFAAAGLMMLHLCVLVLGTLLPIGALLAH